MIAINNQTNSKINLKLVKEVVNNFLKHYHLENSEVSLAFVGEKTIQRLNKEYRDKDAVTDILSFIGEGNDLGEIIICYPEIKRQAKLYSQSTEEELTFIMIHGLLHLIGHEDKTQKGRTEMNKLGQKLAEKF